MISLAKARELAELINVYTQASIDFREFKISFDEYDQAKRKMSKCISDLIVITDMTELNLEQVKPAADDVAEKKRQRRNFLARQRRAYKK